MIRCKHCKYKFEYTGKPCPVCGTKPSIDKNDVEIAKRELAAAIAEKNSSKIFTYCHILADSGNTDAIRDYAKLLERDTSDPKNIDSAMNYYYLAAKQNDPYSAYRYSRLVGRRSQRAADFWLRFSAVLGSVDSYPETAEYFEARGEEEVASYYYSLAAAAGNTDATVTMAKRWSTGTGHEANVSYAKWYIDKIAMPPISAIKLAYKIRSVQPVEPPNLTFPEYSSYIKKLASEANELGYSTAEFYLVSILAHSGNVNAQTNYGIMLIEGIGCQRNVERGKECLESNIRSGNPTAALYLGEEYIKGINVEQNAMLAIDYFYRAAELGYSEAYEKIGDIYREGELVEKDVAKAIELYEVAATGGCESAKQKASELKTTRENFYIDAYKTINNANGVTRAVAFDAYRSAAIATAMGETRAMTLLARCYAAGFGTECDKASAFFWFTKSAEAGNTDAYYPLALCYSRGFGTAFSYSAAITHLKRAQSAGMKAASVELDTLYKRRMKKMVRSIYSTAMRLIHQRKYEEAARLLITSESLGYPKALYTLGCLYEFGRGVSRCDKETAAKYYARATTGNSVFGTFLDPNSKYKVQILKMVR